MIKTHTNIAEHSYKQKAWECGQGKWEFLIFSPVLCEFPHFDFRCI